MKIIQVIEHQEIENISDKFYKVLEDITKTTHFLTFSSKGKIKTTQYVGVIAYKDEVLEIYPKVSKENNLEVSKKILVKMLKKANLNIKILDKASLEKFDTLLEIFIKIFLNLAEEVIRKGLVKEYVLVEENVKFLKGKLNIVKHIQKNFAHKERFFIKYDEYLIDSIENRILKTALKKVYKFASDRLKKRIRGYLFVFDEVSLISKSELKKLQFNRLNIHYKRAINLAKLFLQNSGVDIYKGDEEVISILFDMNILFEKYLSSFYQRDEIQKSKKFFNIQIRPDIVTQCRVLDTKWKVINSFKDVSASDIYQMLVYAIKFNKRKVSLIYPYYECEKIEFIKEKLCNKEVEFEFLFFDLINDCLIKS